MLKITLKILIVIMVSSSAYSLDSNYYNRAVAREISIDFVGRSKCILSVSSTDFFAYYNLSKITSISHEPKVNLLRINGEPIGILNTKKNLVLNGKYITCNTPIF